MEHGLLNSIHCVMPKGDFIPFENDEAYRKKGIEWKLFAERSPKKEFLYKANGNQVKVKLVGYEEYGKNMYTVVVEFEDGRLSCVHPAYLKEMQRASFGKESLIGENRSLQEATLLPEEQSMNESESVRNVNSNKSKSKKEPSKPKLVLPEEKVHFTAKIKEFTAKMNHFTGEEEEVILLELVKVGGENELEVGEAWCSYSKTLKKAELEEGNELEFDGKIVDKKFNKDIRYKINNPSKLIKK